ncbi:MAG: NAD(P)-binding domain-containing protein [Saprospiraceae bacterium]|nr:NAD(P)-binding domain-containing protein [Saprospiraceae bacterium]
MRVCVVGAGCSGITTIKNLLQAGVENIVCYEQQSVIGGNWVYTADIGHSSVCETTHIISSKSLSEYSDFPMPDDYPDYPSHRQVLSYFEAYADHYGVKPYIRFNTRINHISKIDGEKWKVQADDGTEEVFDYLLIASGHHAVPRHPILQGDFKGTYIHSHAFKNNTPFKDKNVLVIGAGNSGCDCAVECSRVAEKVWISMRRPHYIIPKFFLGKPTDTFNKGMSFLPEWMAGPLRKLSLKVQIGSYEEYGLKNPDFPIVKDHPTLNSELLYKIRHGNVLPKPGIKSVHENNVTFEDESTEQVDVIIGATGYKIFTPFFDSDFLDYSEADRVELYLRMFHPVHRTLIFIGLVQPQGAVWPLSDAQAQLAANYIIGNYRIPANVGALARKDSDFIERSFLKSKRHTIEVHYHPYLKTLQREIPTKAPQWSSKAMSHA